MPDPSEDMVERVARAILEAAGDRAMGDTDDLSCVLIDGDMDLIGLARAAIEAMREPTEAMLQAQHMDAMWDEPDEGKPAAYYDWRAMIDAALPKTPQTAEADPG
jgi:hypothetical protein